MHLLFLAGARRPPGFWPFTLGLLVCYSLPFLVLWMIRTPKEPLRARSVGRALFVVIFAISLFLPTRRFFPGYHPESLEGLAYLFVPLLECGLIALFLVVSSVLPGWHTQK